VLSIKNLCEIAVKLQLPEPIKIIGKKIVENLI
jgi:hypothetical protein